MSFRMEIPNEIKGVIDRLEAAGFEAYVVGGCVRDAYLGNTPYDYDITTSAFPEETMKVFEGERIIETGLKHGTVALYHPNGNIEITTYRVDGSYSDNRHPDSVSFTRSLSEDLARRDFTCNAMAYSPKAGLVDLYGGRADIEAKRIVTVGRAEKRFDEDALRIMRALRFSSVLGFDIEPETSKAVHDMKERLRGIAAERTAVELRKLLCGRDAGRVVRDYCDVLGVMIRDFEKLRGFDQKTPYHDRDLLDHTISTLEALPPQADLRLAALLHDVGKIDTQTFGEDERAHYYGHPEKSAERAFETCDALKLSKKERDRIVSLVRLHDIRFSATEKSVRRDLGKYGEEFMRELCLLMRADTMAHNPSGIERNMQKISLFEAYLEKALASSCVKLAQLAVSGDDLIGIGYNQGVEIGKTLNNLFDMVIAGKLENSREVLLCKAKEMKGK